MNLSVSSSIFADSKNSSFTVACDDFLLEWQPSSYIFNGATYMDYAYKGAQLLFVLKTNVAATCQKLMWPLFKGND